MSFVALFYDCNDASVRGAALSSAAHCVASGQLVVLPTDTVYGLGTDAFSPSAIGGLLAAKGRGRDMPVPVLVGSWHTIDGLAMSVSTSMRNLVRAFWPGALSLVVRQAPSVQWDLGDARGTVMLRMPLHPVAIELLREIGPMAVSSANISGRPPAVSVGDARQQLGDLVDVYLDGGPAAQQAASTILDLTSPEPRILRSGPVSAERIAEVLGVDAESLAG
jgi:L-threonylcarbamoyladenylate synthase